MLHSAREYSALLELNAPPRASNWRTRKVHKELKQGADVSTCGFSPGGRLFWCADDDKKVTLYNVGSWTEVQQLEQVARVPATCAASTTRSCAALRPVLSAKRQQARPVRREEPRRQIACVVGAAGRSRAGAQPPARRLRVGAPLTPPSAEGRG